MHPTLGRISLIVAGLALAGALVTSTPFADARVDRPADRDPWASVLRDESGRIVDASGVLEGGIPVHFSMSLTSVGESVRGVTSFAHGRDLLRIERSWEPDSGMTVVVTDGIETQRMAARANAPDPGVTVVYTLPDGRTFTFLVDRTAGTIDGDLEGLRREQAKSGLERKVARFTRLTASLGNAEMLEMRIFEPTYWDCVGACTRGCRMQCAPYCETSLSCNVCYSACYLGCNIGCY